jgi:hypothetical protein
VDFRRKIRRVQEIFIGTNSLELVVKQLLMAPTSQKRQALHAARVSPTYSTFTMDLVGYKQRTVDKVL